MTNKKLTKTELEIMDYIWETNDEILASDIRKHFSHKNWSKQTISSYLKKLVNIKLLKVRKESIVKYYYSASISKNEYELLPAKDILEKVYKGSLRAFFCAFISPNIDEKEIDELQNMLQEFKKNNS